MKNKTTYWINQQQSIKKLKSKWALDHLRSYYTFLYIYAFLYYSLCFYTIYLLFGKIFTQNYIPLWENFHTNLMIALNFWENFHIEFLMKGAIEIDTYIYLSEKDKQITSVGFSKKEIKNHKGISGLKYYLIILYLRKHVQTFER